MSPTGKALLASALTLPLVAFVAGMLASPDPVDPDRSRPVIIGRVSDDTPADKPTRAPDARDDARTGSGDDDGDDRDDGAPGEDSVDPPGTVVTPQPRNVDGDDDDGDDDEDDDGDDDTDDRGGSGDD